MHHYQHNYAEMNVINRKHSKCSEWGIPEFNDSHTLVQNAAIWNEAMAELGYTEDA